MATVWWIFQSSAELVFAGLCCWTSFESVYDFCCKETGRERGRERMERKGRHNCVCDHRVRLFCYDVIVPGTLSLVPCRHAHCGL